MSINYLIFPLATSVEFCIYFKLHISHIPLNVLCILLEEGVWLVSCGAASYEVRHFKVSAIFVFDTCQTHLPDTYRTPDVISDFKQP